MFERTKAIGLYKKMLKDLVETKKTLENTEYDDGFERGTIIIPSKKSNKKVEQYLNAFATRDNYNFSSYAAQDVVEGSLVTLYTIDNETEEFKAKERSEIEKIIMDLHEEKTKEENTKKESKILSFEEYKNKKNAM